MSITLTDPYSKHEILMLDDPAENGVLGVLYHPQIIALPIPWRSCCAHCATGRQTKLKPHLKREIQMLCTRSIRNDVIEYHVPSNSRPYFFHCKIDEHGWCVRVIRPGIEDVLDVIRRPGEKTVFSGNPRAFQSRILHRCLKFLLSGRETPRNEIAACIATLVAQQTAKKRIGVKVGRHPCQKIDWSTLIRFTHSTNSIGDNDGNK